MPNREQTKTEVLQGTLDPIVLQTVDSLGPSHGYAIASRLEQVSGGALQLNIWNALSEAWHRMAGIIDMVLDPET